MSDEIPSKNQSGATRPGATTPGELNPSQRFLAQNRQFLSLLNLFAALFLVYFALTNFMQGLVFLPLGFAFMAVYFFFYYLRNSLKVDFGKFTAPMNLLVMLAALVCILLGVFQTR